MSKPTYSFWNGKNLNGTNDYFFDMSHGESCSNCGFRCVEGGETVSAADL